MFAITAANNERAEYYQLSGLLLCSNKKQSRDAIGCTINVITEQFDIAYT